jgi:hypothetical protein
MKLAPISIEIERANAVALRCFSAADSCNHALIDLARRDEQEFERRYGVSWRERATVKYDDYLRGRCHGVSQR